MKNELEKCLSGEFYDCHDPLFLEYKRRASELTQAYNALPYDAKPLKRSTLEKLFGRIGHSVSVGQPFFCDYGCHIEIGDNVTVNTNCIFVDCNRISIGNNVLIAPNVQIYTATHPVELAERLVPDNTSGELHYTRHTYALPVTLGDGCWIGGGVIILPGVRIGAGAVIGAGSVVTKDIPPNVIAVGNPCRVIRKINEPLPEKLKWVVFDLDGTLGDTLPMCIESFRKAVSPYAGHELSDEEIVQTFGLNEAGMIRQVVQEKWEEALEDFYPLYEKMHDRCPAPFPGIRELLTALKARNIRLGLITGKGKRSCEISLKRFNLESFFDSVYTGSDFCADKRESMRRLMKEQALSPSEWIYVGDTVSDVRASEECGIRCLSAAWRTDAQLQTLQKINAPFVFQSVDALRQYLL